MHLAECRNEQRKHLTASALVLISHERPLATEVFVVPLQEADVKEITWRMDVIIKLMVALFAKEFNNIDAIVKLENMKLSREQIASALGITKENVAQQLYIASKKLEKKAKRNQEQAVAPEPSTEIPSTATEEA